MKIRSLISALFILSALVLAPGCNGPMPWDPPKPVRRNEVKVPPELRGTVAEVAQIITGTPADVGNWGVVIGLTENGSAEIPPHLYPQMVKYVKGQQHINDAKYGFKHVSVKRFLQDRDTAIVHVDTIVPPGTPKGALLDVDIVAAPQTQTLSLADGELLWTMLSPKRGEVYTNTRRHAKPIARASGTLFVNPFLNPKDPNQAGGFLKARIIGGAITTKDMPIRLQLFNSNYAICNLLQKRINQRFTSRLSRHKVAVAKEAHYLNITVPAEYRNNYAHFLNLVLHMPRTGTHGMYVTRARRIGASLALPNAPSESLALIWEAMGKSILPEVQKLYSSKNDNVRYYAARTGLRLGDKYEAGPIILKYAKNPGDYQLRAINELGKYPYYLGATEILNKLLDDQNELVRIEAYEASVKRKSSSRIKRYRIDGFGKRPAFVVDVVDSKGEYVIYATSSGTPKIVLFGESIPVSQSIFFTSEDHTLTIDRRYGPADKDKLASIEAQIKKLSQKIAVYQERKKRKANSDGITVSKHTSTGLDLINNEPQTDSDTSGLPITKGEYNSWLRQKTIMESKLKFLKSRHLTVYRTMNKHQYSKKFTIDFNLLELLTVLGEKPRLDPITQKVPGLGFSYSRILRTLYLLTEKNKFINAKFILQPLPETQRMYRNIQSTAR